MAYEIINSKRSKSVIRYTGNTATLINIADMAADGTETISSASITHAISSSDGWVRIYRGNDTNGVLVLELNGSVDLPLAMYDISVANSSTSNVYITNSGAGGTVILNFSKKATYSTNLDAA